MFTQGLGAGLIFQTCFFIPKKYFWNIYNLIINIVTVYPLQGIHL